MDSLLEEGHPKFQSLVIVIISTNLKNKFVHGPLEIGNSIVPNAQIQPTLVALK